MKLLPKARPVQCKLILGGKVITTQSDLLDKFFLSEIIGLGEKFSLLLRRDEELKCYSADVHDIFKENKRDEDVALALINLFFNANKDTLMEVLIDWMNEGKKTEILSNLFSFVSLDIPNALLLLQNRKEDDQWMLDRLKEVEGVIKNIQYNHDTGGACAKFCFEYSQYLKKYDERRSRRWLKEASGFGNEEAKKLLEEEKLVISDKLPEEWDIPVRGRVITLVKVIDKKHCFYICKKIIVNWFYESLNSGGVNYDKSENSRKRGVCDKFLKSLSEVTGYKWDYPTDSQWNKANKLGLLQFPNKNTRVPEWCQSMGGGKYRVTNYNGLTVNAFVSCFLRPVINIKDNPQLKK